MVTSVGVGGLHNELQTHYYFLFLKLHKEEEEQGGVYCGDFFLSLNRFYLRDSHTVLFSFSNYARKDRVEIAHLQNRIAVNLVRKGNVLQFLKMY